MSGWLRGRVYTMRAHVLSLFVFGCLLLLLVVRAALHCATAAAQDEIATAKSDWTHPAGRQRCGHVECPRALV